VISTSRDPPDLYISFVLPWRPGYPQYDQYTGYASYHSYQIELAKIVTEAGVDRISIAEHGLCITSA